MDQGGGLDAQGLLVETLVRQAVVEHALDEALKGVDAGDVDRLRAQGLSDEAILGAVTLVAYQNAISRMHHGLAAMRTRHRGDGERT